MTHKLKIIPLGGLGEIGKNMTAIEFGTDIIVVDCGLGFPDEDMYGIDIVLPETLKEEDYTALVAEVKNEAGVGMDFQTRAASSPWQVNL